MKTSSLPFPLTHWFLAAAISLGAISQSRAQWIGAGTTGGTGGTDINTTTNWTGSSINGAFTGNTSAASLSLSGNITVSSLDFRWATTDIGLTLGGTGTINLSGDVLLPTVVQGNANPITFGSNVTLALGSFSTTRTLNDGNTSNGRLVIDGLLTGTASGSGFVQFGGTATNTTITLNNTGNTFDAPIKVASGILNFASIGNVGGGASALGTASTVANGTITLGRNSVLAYTGSTDQSSDRAVVFSNLTAGPVLIQHKGTGGTLTYASDLAFGTYGGDFRSAAAAGTKLVFNGLISNTGAATTEAVVNYTGVTGTTVFGNAANTYGGFTQIQAGVLEVTKLADGGVASGIGKSASDAGNLILGNSNSNSATLRYLGAGDSTDRLFSLTGGAGGIIDSSGTVGALKFTNTGAVAFGTAGLSRKLTLTGSNTNDNTLAVAIGDNGAGQTSFAKQGVGKWIVTGTNTYTGATTVSAGALLINGSTAAGSTVTVAAGATLGGSGQINGAVVVNGSLAPGNSIDELTVANDVTWNGILGNGWKFELGTVSGSSDLLAITGVGSDFLKGSGNTFRFDFLGTGVNGTFALASWAGTTTFNVDASEFSYTNLASGLTGDFAIVGNQLMLTVVPEPSAAVLAGLGFAALLFRQRKPSRH